ncbi:MAG: TldD/PmbA family protein [Candidatus Scalindua sp.]|nr:TldD/PmbA family protein [Candidatus Scalindua sp.]
MIKIEDLRTSVHDALHYLKGKKDVADAEIFASWNDLITIRTSYTSDIPCNGVQEPKSLQSYGLGLLVVFKKGNRRTVGFGTVTNDLTIDGVSEALAKAKRNMVFDQDFKSLPDPMAIPTLQNYHDNTVMKISETDSVDLGWKVLKGSLEAFDHGGYKKSIIIGGDVTILKERMAIKSTRGIDDFDESTSLTANITAMIERKNVKGSGWSLSTHLDRFHPEEAGREAAESAVRTIGGKRMKSGKYPVIFGNQPLTDIATNVLLPSLNLTSVNSSNTPFLGKLGQKISSPDLNIYDDGSIQGEIGSTRITCEGIPTGRTDLIANGTLVGFLANSYFAEKLKNSLYHPIPRNGFRYTSCGRDYKVKAGISPTNVIMEGSTETAGDELLQLVNNGVYIGRIWYTYPINGLTIGDFTSTIIADSFLIRDGKISTPLAPNTIRINANIKEMLQNIIGISKERRSTSVWGSKVAVIAPEIAVREVQLDSIGYK